MPVPLTYPGVYVEEIPSGVRTITGVATSITAFVGRARRGPVNRPVSINSFADFERRFGGLWSESTMSYAVRDFYVNGGSSAIVVRVFNPTEDGPNRVTFAGGGLTLEATYEGSWATAVSISAHAPDEQLAEEIAEDLDVEPGQIFNLLVNDRTSGIREVFNNVTIVDSRRRIDRVLDNESMLVRVRHGQDGEPELPDDFSVPAPGAPLEFSATPDPAAPDSNAANLDGAVLTSDNYIVPTGDVADHLTNYVGSTSRKQGLFALDDADLVNLLCIPPFSFDEDVTPGVWAAAAAYAAGGSDRTPRRAIVLIDPPSGWTSVEDARDGLAVITNELGSNKKNAALFFPRLRKANPIRENQIEDFAPCGTVAGVFARIDSQRGVWKAPAGLEAGLVGVPAFSVLLSDDENGQLNPLGVNCLRLRPAAGPVIWGSRTLAGHDLLASEWKYIPVRRVALFLEESLYRGTQWAVFEPNDEPLWAELRLNIGAFMQNLFRQGAFQGSSPKEAYFVKCDKETTTQNDINLGIVNVLVGFAPLKPAEFVVIRLQQMAGQIQT
jgi:phage tail sheath protein FI